MRRDPKGRYAKARAGTLRNVTGIGSPYEPPPSPDLRLDTTVEDADALARRVVDGLRTRSITKGWSPGTPLPERPPKRPPKRRDSPARARHNLLPKVRTCGHVQALFLRDSRSPPTPVGLTIDFRETA